MTSCPETARTGTFPARSLAAAGAIGVMLAMVSPPLHAQSDPASPSAPAASPQQTVTSWNVNLGLGVAARPVYPGAKRYEASPVPMLSVRYRDTVFLTPEGLGINLVNYNGFRAGPLLSYFAGRDQGDDARLNGLGDIQPSLAAGAFLAYRFDPFEVAAELRQAVTHTGNGLLGSVRADYRTRITPQAVLTLGLDMHLANGKYERTWFGVSDRQSANSGLPVYTPGGGLQDVGLHANLTWNWSRHIATHVFVAVKQLVSDAADSPIVERKTQVMGGVGLGYRF